MILDQLALRPWETPRLANPPGMQPLDLSQWLTRDTCYAAHMRMREELLTQKPVDVMAQSVGNDPALSELMAVILNRLADDPGYQLRDDHTICPDGRVVSRDDPILLQLGRLVQEDLLVLQPSDALWVLTAGVLCFPSHWTLAQKIGKDLDPIHAPVPFYAETLAKRVRRFFDALQPGRALWRANWLIYPSAELHYPMLEYATKTVDWDASIYMRVERQSLVKLPKTGTVVFSIKTDISPLSKFTKHELLKLETALTALPAAQYNYKGGDALLAAVKRYDFH